MHNIYWKMLQREMSIQLSNKAELSAVLIFYVIVISLFPIALGPDMAANVWVVPAIIWVAVLLSAFLVQEQLLRQDYNIGMFEQLLLSTHHTPLLVCMKILAHWLIFVLPILIVTPLLAISMGFTFISIVTITCSLCLGTITLSFIGALGAALTISLPRGGTLLAVVLLPLYVPVLVLGTSVTSLSLDGILSMGHVALLAALAIAACMFIPFAVSAAIKVSMD